jgi:predicted amidohydrolase
MILDPYGDILAESDSIGDDMVIADLDLDLIPSSTGRRWIKTRRPNLYDMLHKPLGIEEDTRTVRFSYE